MRFIHFTDTHFLIDYKQLKERYGIYYDPTERLIFALKNIRYEDIDFMVITGDLVNEGEKEDYLALYKIIEDYLPNEFPVFYLLGNHDNKEAFYQSIDIDKSSDRFYYSKNIEGYNLIFLDTSTYLGAEGSIEGDQYEWLVNEVNNNEKNIIFQHHPLEFSFTLEKDERFITKVPTDFYDRLDTDRVIAIFCGHLHMKKRGIVNKIPQFCGNALFYGISIDYQRNHIWTTDIIGYSICEISNNILTIDEYLVNPEERYMTSFLNLLYSHEVDMNE